MLERIGNYKVVSELGRGGMGLVLKAYDESLKRHVAIKVLSEELTRDATFTARFIREAQSAAQLSHPNITQIYSIGQDQERHFFVMEFVEGRSLHQLVREEGKLAPHRAAGYILQAAHGLAAAHDLGVVHRDIKPANLMVAKNGLVKIADFGLAVMPSDMARLTSTGMLMGTPGYISPEQCMGEEADARTDIYSLGVSFYELLAGTIPFQADSPLALVRQVVDVMPKDVSTYNPDVDPECKAILQKMMAKTRPARWQNCHELVVAFEAYLGSPGIITGAARATQRAQHGGVAVMAAVKTPLPDVDDGPATEILTARPAASARTATSADGPPTELLTPSAPLPATLRDPAAAGLVTAREQRPAATRAAEHTLMIPTEVASAEAATKRSRAGVVAAIVILALAAGGFAAWRNQQDNSSASGAQATLLTQPAETNDRLAATAGGDDLTSADTGITVTDPGDAAASEVGSETNHVSSSGGEGLTAEASGGAGRAEPTSQLAQAQSVPPVVRPSGGRSDPEARGVAPPMPGREATARVALPALPKVALLTRGEPGLASALEQHLQRSLRDAGLELADLENDADLSDLMYASGGEVSVGAIAPRLAGAGIHVIALIQVEPVSERMLSYMGRQELATTAKAKVNVFRVDDKKAMGPGWSAKLEYTSLSAEKKAESFSDDKGGEIASAIREGWAAYRGR